MAAAGEDHEDDPRGHPGAGGDQQDADHAVNSGGPAVRGPGRRRRGGTWHRAHVSNGPTEANNNLIKRVKRVAFGFRRFAHYRIRALLYAGKPNWDLLATITPR